MSAERPAQEGVGDILIRIEIEFVSRRRARLPCCDQVQLAAIREIGCLDEGWVEDPCSTLPATVATDSKREVSMPFARRSRQSTLAKRSTSSRSTADFGVIVGNYRGLECLVILGILERHDDGLSGEAVAQGIAARMLFAFRRRWSGAFKRVAAIGFDLFERCHCGSVRTIGFDLLFERAQCHSAWPGAMPRPVADWPNLLLRRPSVFRRGLGGIFIGMRVLPAQILAASAPTVPWQLAGHRFSDSPTRPLHCRPDVGGDDDRGRAAR